MRITIRAVAEKANTSVAAVSATLSGRSGTIRVGEATRERIFQAAAELGYIPNPIAKSLATGRTRTLGLMLPYADAFVVQDPFCGQVLSGIMREAVDEHYNVMLYTATSGSAGEEAARQVDRRVDGVLLVMPAPDSQVFAKCEKQHIPYVSVLRVDANDPWTVNSDDFDGGFQATRHLIELGHRRIAHLKGNPEVATTEPRERGYRAALEQAGLEVRQELILQAGFDWRAGYRVTKDLLELPEGERPSAIFACNDLCAEGALKALRESAISTPDEMSVVGYDDTWHAARTDPPLTSVRMPIAEMGALAARMLIARMEGRSPEESAPVLPVSLTVRHSSGAFSPPTIRESPKAPSQPSR